MDTMKGSFKRGKKSVGAGYNALSQDEAGVGCGGIVDAPHEDFEAESEAVACPVGSHVRFDLDSTIVYEITPYSEVYGMHPRYFNFDRSDDPPAWCFVAPPDTTRDGD